VQFNRPAGYDTDNDGMPDWWELDRGFNIAAANNNSPSRSGSGYTQLEDYLNYVTKHEQLGRGRQRQLVRQQQTGWAARPVARACWPDSTTWF